jgi:tRNA threonylcarbamoyladenosine biosynthesis protein TsaE
LKIICRTLNELPAIAGEVYNFGKDKNIWLLKGDLGAGKTTFINEVTNYMGVRDHVSSPSYALVNEYLITEDQKVFHLDLFRLKSVYEAHDIGIEEYLDSGNYCFIEWPEVIGSMITDNYLDINIQNPEKEIRIFNIQKYE